MSKEKYKDVSGHKFGMLLAIERDPNFTKDKKYKCVCDCGNHKTVMIYDLVKGKTKSCGCLLDVRNKEIVNMFSNGETVKVISKKMELSEVTICQVLRNAGIKREPSKSTRHKDEIIRLYGEGHTFIEISKLLNISEGLVANCLTKHIPERRAAKVRFKLSDDTQRQIVEAYKAGAQASEIYESFGIKYSLMKYALNRYGVEAREPHKRRSMAALDESAFKVINRDSLYWAGMLGADGNVSKNTVSLYLHQNDEYLLYRFKEFLKTDINVSRKKDCKCSFLSVTRKEMAEDLIPFGITPKKSLTYSPPQFCCDSADFWRGAIDGDGSITVVKGALRVDLCGSFNCMTSYLEWVRKNCEAKCNVCANGSIFRVCLSGKNAIKIAKILYAGSPKYFMERKYEKAKPFLDGRV